MRTPYWTKKGRLGMTRTELLEKLNNGGGGYDPQEENKPIAFIGADEFATMLGGTTVTRTVQNYDATKFQPYMTLVVDLTTPIILYAGVFRTSDDSNYFTSLFSNTFYNELASAAYCITATLVNRENREFAFTATQL